MPWIAGFILTSLFAVAAHANRCGLTANEIVARYYEPGAAVGAYAELLWSHIEQEENQMLALAREYLHDDDWRSIDEAFSANDDPLFGPRVRDEFARLKTHIITQLPRKLKVRKHN